MAADYTKLYEEQICVAGAAVGESKEKMKIALDSLAAIPEGLAS
jgi:hypothetical protein